MENIIEVGDIKKYYRIAKRGKGMTASLKYLFNRSYEIKKAVDTVSFSIKRGEIVGFIGPNGAGKSTTIKILSGILYPDAGDVTIRGYIPYKQRKQYVKHIGVVFGQKTQLNWDLPLIESFELMKFIYRIPQEKYEKNLSLFSKLLEMEDFINQPVRQLSLGQRMRGDIVAALLHSPEIVFLDEPTIGLDVVAKEKIREFIRYINEKEQTTILFTTHDMQDIEKVCDRLIIIDKGKKIYDGSIDQIKNKYANSKTVEILLENDEKETRTFDISETPMNTVMENLFAQKNIKDISICEPEIDGIIRDIYEGRLVLDDPTAKETV
ncbi:MAG: ATP-binding cassette domain-containing protein [Lachnospiraceae bacterium]|nr:ATP-binding cassette domain-containing protein [Lachnospiraceae bacterium]MBD5483337.1 ATP-binding cassette domain-containing protein [Lachnospiraceae bacterium]